MVVVAGGPGPNASDSAWILKALGGYDAVIAADSGYDIAMTLGLAVDVLVGDLDSISVDGLVRARASGVEIRSFSIDKDFTDLELALDVAVEMGAVHDATRVTLIDSGAGRFDHVVSNLMLLTSDHLEGLAIRALVAGSVVQVCRPGHNAIIGHPGDVVTLMAATPLVEGITTTGLQYSLASASLRFGQTLGVSNVLVADHAELHHRTGVLLVFQPTAERIAR